MATRKLIAVVGATGTCLGSGSHDRIALAAAVAGRPTTRFSAWARTHLPAAYAPA